MSSGIPEVIKTHENVYLEKLLESERAKEVYNKAQFDLLAAQSATFEAFKKWSSVKEQFLVELVNQRSSQQKPDTVNMSTKTEE